MALIRKLTLKELTVLTNFNFHAIWWPAFLKIFFQNMHETMITSYIWSLISNNKRKMTGDGIIGVMYKIVMLPWSLKNRISEQGRWTDGI